MADFISTILVPAITIIFLICIFGFLLFVIGRFFIRFWRQRLKFFLRYTIFRTKYDDLIVKECIEAINNKADAIKFKMHLLVSGYTTDEIYEILYIFNKVSLEMGIKPVKVINNRMKGGKK